MGFWKKTFLGPTTIRWSLVRNIALLLLVTGAAILGATLWFAQGTVESLSRTLIQRATSRTDGELHAFFSLPEANLKMARRWGRKGLLRAGDKKGLNALFIPLMRTCPQVSSVMVANDTGVEHLILRKKDGWLVRVVRVDEWGSKAQWTLYDMEGNKKKAYWKELKYDPRKRPWYQGARRHKATTEPFWTKPYTFFTTKDPGITAAMTWQRREGGASKEAGALHHVVGYDLLLTDISKFTTRIQVSKNGKAFVLTPDGQVVGLPSHPRFNDPASVKEAVLQPASKLGIPAVAAAVEAWKKRDRPQRFFSFSQGGGDLVGGVQALLRGPPPKLLDRRGGARVGLHRRDPPPAQHHLGDHGGGAGGGGGARFLARPALQPPVGGPGATEPTHPGSRSHPHPSHRLWPGRGAASSGQPRADARRAGVVLAVRPHRGGARADPSWGGGSHRREGGPHHHPL